MPTHHRDIGSFRQDLTIHEHREIPVGKCVERFFPALPRRDGRNRPCVDSGLPEGSCDVGNMAQINTEDQGRPPIPSSMKIRSDNQVVDGCGIDVLGE